MASNGLLQYAKKGKCRICYRTRSTDIYVKPVGEVRHGFATGHIWECIDADECEKVALEKIKTNHPDTLLIEKALRYGRYGSYKIFN